MHTALESMHADSPTNQPTAVRQPAFQQPASQPASQPANQPASQSSQPASQPIGPGRASGRGAQYDAEAPPWQVYVGAHDGACRELVVGTPRMEACIAVTGAGAAVNRNLKTFGEWLDEHFVPWLPTVPEICVARPDGSGKL